MSTAGAFLGLHTVALLALLVILHSQHQPPISFTHHGWDTAFYLHIARNGYHFGSGSQYAFFPLFPLLIRAVVDVFRLGFPLAGYLTSIVAGTIAGVGIRFVGEQVKDARTGMILMALWAVAPTSVIQVWPYADGLFVAFAAWALFALLRRAWITVGVLTFFAGITRPTATSLITAVGLAALVAVIRRQDGWRPWICGAIAPMGFVGYILAVGHHFGHLDGYFRMQRSDWANWIDGGKETVDTITAMVDGRADNPSVMYLITASMIIGVPFLLLLTVLDRQPWPLIVYSAVTLLFVLCSNRQLFTTPRELLPAFPLLIPMAAALSRVRLSRLVVALAVLAALSGWYAWFMPIVYGAP